jgi:hypothetical protein
VTETSTVAVIDQTGRHHHFDPDDWYVRESGHVDVTKESGGPGPVATFAPGFLGIYRVGARAGAAQFGGGGGGAQ